MALGKPAIASFPNAPYTLVTDGDYDSSIVSGIFITTNCFNPFITIDLGEVFHVQMIAVLNREDTNPQIALRLGTSELRVGDNPASTLASANANPSCGVVVNDSGLFDCNLKGRYVTLRRVSA